MAKRQPVAVTADDPRFDPKSDAFDPDVVLPAGELDGEMPSMAELVDDADRFVVAPGPANMDEINDQLEMKKAEFMNSTIGMARLGAEIGMLLLQAKVALQPGEWLVWLADECHYSERMAQYLMSLARNASLIAELDPETSIRGALKAIAELKQKKGLAERRANPTLPQRIDVDLPSGLSLEEGDCAALPFADGTFDLIVTSPPFGLGLDYADTDDTYGHDVYLEMVEDWAAEIARVLRQPTKDEPGGGRLVLDVALDVSLGDGGDRMTVPLYAEWVTLLMDAGLNYRTTILWTDEHAESANARGSVDSPAAPHVWFPGHALIVMHTGDWKRKLYGTSEFETEEGHRQWVDWLGGHGFWRIPNNAHPSKSTHPGKMPVEVVRRAVQAFSYQMDVVGDPFAGSGTTLYVARKMNRIAYGVDKSPQYVAEARTWLSTL